MRFVAFLLVTSAVLVAPGTASDRQDTISIELTAAGAVVMKWPAGDPKSFARIDSVSTESDRKGVMWW